LEVEADVEELLLRAIVKLAREVGPRGVGGFDDPTLCGPRLGRMCLGDVALTRRAFEATAFLDVGEGHDRASAGWAVDRG
jgi:hypothetical protein